MHLTPYNCGHFDLPLRDLLNIPKSLCKKNVVKPTDTYDKYKQFIDQLKAKKPDLIFYNPENIFVRNGYINISNNDVSLYSDAHHLSDFGSKTLVDDLLKNIYPANANAKKLQGFE